MSRAYLLLIGVLILIVVGVGAYAFLRSSSTPAVPYQPPVVNQNQNPAPPQLPSPVPTTFQNQISLIVSSPTKNQVVTAATLTVSGKTVPNADVSVNDKDLKANAQGNFSALVTLDEGENEIVVTASDDAGNFSEWQTTVTYTPAQ